MSNSTTVATASLFTVMESAWRATQVDMARQAAENRLAWSRRAVVLCTDDDALTGYINRHERLSSKEVDGTRFDAGFWGDGPITRTHCGAKAKRTMIRKRGRV